MQLLTGIDIFFTVLTCDLCNYAINLSMHLLWHTYHFSTTLQKSLEDLKRKPHSMFVMCGLSIHTFVRCFGKDGLKVTGKFIDIS